MKLVNKLKLHKCITVPIATKIICSVLFFRLASFALALCIKNCACKTYNFYKAVWITKLLCDNL